MIMYRRIILKEYECYVDDQNGILYERIEGMMIPLDTNRIVEMMIESGEFDKYLKDFQDKG